MNPPKGPAPEELSDYLIARKFWTNLGIPSTYLPLDQWVDEQVRRYQIVMDVYANWEAAQAELARQSATRKADKQPPRR
jgi:hypothetical protein